MSEAWKTWEGQAVDGFPLRQYLGGSDHSAVYLTPLNSSGEQKAAIKFIPADTSAYAQLAKSAAADVWSLGVTLVEALTQRTPIVRGQMDVELPVPENIPQPYLEIARR